MKPDVRKMCWVAWDKLTLPKIAGGLGFKEIEVFNDALFTKHAWRLLKNTITAEKNSAVIIFLIAWPQTQSHIDRGGYCRGEKLSSEDWAGI